MMSMRLIIRTGPAETVVVGAMGTSSSTAGPRCSVSVLRRFSWGADAADDVTAGAEGCDVAGSASVLVAGCVIIPKSLPGSPTISTRSLAAFNVLISTDLLGSSDVFVVVAGRDDAPATASCDEDMQSDSFVLPLYAAVTWPMPLPLSLSLASHTEFFSETKRRLYLVPRLGFRASIFSM